MFEADAEQIAAGTFPPAIDVKAIEDCTVDGSTQRKDAEIKRLRQDRIRDEAYRQPEDREEAEGSQQDHEVQAPVQQTGNDDITREACAVQEEQQRDGKIGRHPEPAGKGAARGEDRREDDGANEQDGERIG